jgi:hypothetical protein
MQSLQIQLHFALEGYEPHRWACCRFSYRFRISVISLLGLYIGLHVLRRHQSNPVALGGEGASQEVGAATCLHGNDARWQRGGERDHAFSSDLSSEHDRPTRIQSCEAAAVLTQINSKHGNGRLRHHPLLLFRHQLSARA